MEMNMTETWDLPTGGLAVSVMERLPGQDGPLDCPPRWMVLTCRSAGCTGWRSRTARTCPRLLVCALLGACVVRVTLADLSAHSEEKARDQEPCLLLFWPSLGLEWRRVAQGPVMALRER